MVKNAKVDYDFDYDILYVYTGEKVKDSLEIENFVLDFSFDNKIVAVEIMDASKIISKLSGLKISKEILSEIKSAGISMFTGKEIMYVMIVLPIKMRKERKKIRIPVPAPLAIKAKS